MDPACTTPHGEEQRFHSCQKAQSRRVNWLTVLNVRLEVTEETQSTNSSNTGEVQEQYIMQYKKAANQVVWQQQTASLKPKWCSPVCKHILPLHASSATKTGTIHILHQTATGQGACTKPTPMQVTSKQSICGDTSRPNWEPQVQIWWRLAIQWWYYSKLKLPHAKPATGLGENYVIIFCLLFLEYSKRWAPTALRHTHEECTLEMMQGTTCESSCRSWTKQCAPVEPGCKSPSSGKQSTRHRASQESNFALAPLTHNAQEKIHAPRFLLHASSWVQNLCQNYLILSARCQPRK